LVGWGVGTDPPADTPSEGGGVMGEHAETVLPLEKVRGAIARLLTDDSLEWRAIWEQELAEMLGVVPGHEPWTWRWDCYDHEGLSDRLGFDGGES
jgi:hypothetical protein